MRGKRTSTILSLAASVVLATLFAGVSTAQELRARIQGIVTDSSEAVVAGARVTLRNVNTGVDTVRQTNPAGQYLFEYVSPGLYTLTVELHILVETRGDVMVNAVLQVGAVVETINVVEAPVAVEFNLNRKDGGLWKGDRV